MSAQTDFDPMPMQRQLAFILARTQVLTVWLDLRLARQRPQHHTRLLTQLKLVKATRRGVLGGLGPPDLGPSLDFTRSRTGDTHSEWRPHGANMRIISTARPPRESLRTPCSVPTLHQYCNVEKYARYALIFSMYSFEHLFMYPICVSLTARPPRES
jgi:hypothetical protein